MVSRHVRKPASPDIWPMQTSCRVVLWSWSRARSRKEVREGSRTLPRAEAVAVAAAAHAARLVGRAGGARLAWLEHPRTSARFSDFFSYLNHHTDRMASPCLPLNFSNSCPTIAFCRLGIFFAGCHHYGAVTIRARPCTMKRVVAATYPTPKQPAGRY